MLIKFHKLQEKINIKGIKELNRMEEKIEQKQTLLTKESREIGNRKKELYAILSIFPSSLYFSKFTVTPFIAFVGGFVDEWKAF